MFTTNSKIHSFGAEEMENILEKLKMDFLEEKITRTKITCFKTSTGWKTTDFQNKF
jgi:hypothetical protein